MPRTDTKESDGKHGHKMASDRDSHPKHDAQVVGFTPTTPAHWTDPDPTTVQGGLDNLAAAPADADAIHDNVDGEIVLVAEKATPVSADLLLIEDSAASNAKKRVQIGNLPDVRYTLLATTVSVSV